MVFLVAEFSSFFGRDVVRIVGYDKMHVIPTLSTGAPEFAQQGYKLPYMGLQHYAPTVAKVCRKFVDSKLQKFRRVWGILVVKLENLGCSI